jgi:hypothetical protein
LAGKDVERLVESDSLNMDTSLISRQNMNMIDSNDGSKLARMDLPFEEFDATLRTNLDFQSEGCIKALCLHAGVEDLRAVLHYQLMQQQLLYVATGINSRV